MVGRPSRLNRMHQEDRVVEWNEHGVQVGRAWVLTMSPKNNFFKSRILVETFHRLGKVHRKHYVASPGPTATGSVYVVFREYFKQRITRAGPHVSCRRLIECVPEDYIMLQLCRPHNTFAIGLLKLHPAVTWYLCSD